MLTVEEQVVTCSFHTVHPGFALLSNKYVHILLVLQFLFLQLYLKFFGSIVQLLQLILIVLHLLNQMVMSLVYIFDMKFDLLYFTLHLFYLDANIVQFLLKAMASVVSALTGFLLLRSYLNSNCVAPRNTDFKISSQLLMSSAQV
jgi:hypothetical protein